MHRRPRCDHLDSECMHPTLEFGIERLHNRAMLRYPTHSGEPIAGDTHPEVGGSAVAPARMAAVFLALVDHFKMAGSEFDRKFSCNRVANGHMDTGSTGFDW